MSNLVIGIGGTGGNAIRNLKYKFSLYRSEETVKYLYLDTLSFDKVKKDQEESGKQSSETMLMQVPIDMAEYIHYRGENLKKILHDQIKGKTEPDDIYRWVKAEKFLSQLRIPDKVLSFEAGAGQYRQIGRLAIFQSINDVWNELSNAFSGVGADETLNVYISCSLVGGTGSGGFMDIGIILRELAQQKKCKLHTFLFLVLESAFSDLKGNQEFQHTPERAYAVLRELHRLVQTYTVDSPYIVRYNERYKAEVQESIFDGIFLIDMVSQADIYGEKLRTNSLYPAISDIIELFTEKETGKRLDEDVVNVNSAIRKLQNNFDTESDRSRITKLTDKNAVEIKRNFPDFEPFFSAFSTHRIMFPRQRYIKKISLGLVKSFLSDLFKPDPENNLLRADFYPDGTESGMDEKQVEEAINEELKTFFIGWNNLLGQSFYFNEFSLNKWDDDTESNFMNQRGNPNSLLSICAPGDKMTDIRQLQQFSLEGLDDLCTNDPADRDNITRAIKDAKESFHGETDETIEGNTGQIHEKLKKFKAFWINNLEEKLKTYIESGLTPAATKAKKGRMGYLIRALDQMENRFVESMLRYLEERANLVKKDWIRSKGEVDTLLGKINDAKGGVIFGNLKKIQQDYVKRERQLLKVSKAAIANRYIIDIIKGIREKVQFWKSECERWRNEVITHDNSIWNIIVRENAAINAEIRQLAQSPNISFGLPDEMGTDLLNPRTDMGGYEEYLSRLINFEEKVNSWLGTLEWQIKDDKLYMRLFSENIEVLNGKDFNINLQSRAIEDCENELGNRDIFDYLLNYLPGRSDTPITINESAQKIAEKFSVCKPYLKYDDTYVLVSHYFFFKSPNTPEEKEFIDVLERELRALTHNHGAYNLIDNYEAPEILGYIRIAHGIVSKTCDTTKSYMDAYLEKIQNRSWMMDIYHIFPEEQACVDYERDIVAPLSSINNISDITPYHVVPLFSNKDYLNLFFDLFSLEIIQSALLKEGASSDGVCYLWLGDQTLAKEERDLKDSRNCFYLSNDIQLFHAAINFVNNTPNRNQHSAVQKLPSYQQLIEIRKDVVKLWLADLGLSSEEEVLSQALEDLLGDIEKGEMDQFFYLKNRNVEESFKRIFCNLLKEQIRQYKESAKLNKAQRTSRKDKIKKRIKSKE